MCTSYRGRLWKNEKLRVPGTEPGTVADGPTSAHSPSTQLSPKKANIMTTWSVEYNGRFEPFDAVASERLESAYQMAERPATVSVTFQHETHKVNFSTMEMRARGAQYQVLRLAEAEPSGRKRSRPSDTGASSSSKPDTSKDMDSIDWDRLVNMYDADANGLLDPSELVCFVRDALSLVLGERIDYDLATDVTFSQIALRRECWSGRDVRVDAINSLALRQAAARGVFSELRLARAPAGPLGGISSSDADLAKRLQEEEYAASSSDADLAKRLQEEEYAETTAADGGASVGSSALLGASSDKLPRVVSVMEPHLQQLCLSFDLKRWMGAGECAEGTQEDVGVRAVGRLKGVLVASMLARVLKRSAPVDDANADFDAPPAGMDESAGVPPIPARQNSSRSSLDSLLAEISQGLIVRRSVSAALGSPKLRTPKPPPLLQDRAWRWRLRPRPTSRQRLIWPSASRLTLPVLRSRCACRLGSLCGVPGSRALHPRRSKMRWIATSPRWRFSRSSRQPCRPRARHLASPMEALEEEEV